MNKADYISLINTKLPDGGNIPSTDHRDTMHTDGNSIIELVYKDTVTEDTSGVLTITTKGDFSYIFRFKKVGGIVSLSGQFAPTGTYPAGQVIATITDSDWIAESFDFNGTAFDDFGDTVPFYVNGNQIIAGFAVSEGLTFKINTLIYNSEN